MGRSYVKGSTTVKTFIGSHVALSVDEFAELALGELFGGPAVETAEERAARLDAARDVLDDLWREDPELAEHAARLLDAPPSVLRLPGRTRRKRARPPAPGSVAA